MDPRDAEIEALRAETASLRRSGAEAVHAYSRKKERCDELMESLIDLQARYDALAATTPATTPPSALATLEARVAELELALAAKDDILQGLQAACAEKDSALLEATRKQEAAAAAAEAAAAADVEKEGQETNNTQHQQVMGLVEHAFELLESHPATATATAVAAAVPSSSSSSSTSTTTTDTSTDLNLTERSTQVGTPAMEMSPEKQALKATIQSLLHDLALVKDFAGTELAVTTEVLQEVTEEGLEKEKALSEELGGMKEELGRVQAMMAAVRAEAEEQARRDSQAIQELEVTVQLTKGALLLANQQEQQAAAAAAAAAAVTAAAVMPEGALSPSSTAKLQRAMTGLRSQLQETERRAQEAEIGRGKLMQELEGMEDRLIKAEESLAAAATAAAADDAAATAAAAAAAAAATAAAAAEEVQVTMVGGISTPAKGKPITASTGTSMTPRTPGSTAVAVAAAAAAASTPSSAAVTMQTTAALRRLQAELLQTKAQLNTATTNATLLQRYIATRRLQIADTGAAAAAAAAAAVTTKLVLGKGGDEVEGREVPVRPAAELCASPAPASASKKTPARLLFSPSSFAPAAAVAGAATGGGESEVEAPFPSTSSSGVSSLFSFEAAANYFSFASSSSAAAAAAPARDETN